MKMKFSNKINLSKESVLAFVFLFPFIPINAIDYGSIYDVFMMIDMVLIFSYAIKTKISFNNKPLFFLLLYSIWLVMSCLLNNKNVIYGIFYGGKLFFFVLINQIYLKSNSLIFLKTMKKYMFFLIVVTIFFQFVNQGLFGIMDASQNYRNFFAGDNELGYYYISFISLCIVLDNVNNKMISKGTIFITVLCVISLIKAWSAKSIIAIILIIFYVLFVYKRKIAKILSYKVISLSYIGTFLGIVIFNIQEKFSFFIVEVLNKDVTLTGRTYIWDSVIKNINMSPMIGYGTIAGGRLYINQSIRGNPVSSHNLFLEVLLQTGYVGLVLFISFLLTSLKPNKKLLKNEDYLYLYLMLLFFSFTILIMYISTPSVYLVFAYLPIILCSNLEFVITRK